MKNPNEAKGALVAVVVLVVVTVILAAIVYFWVVSIDFFKKAPGVAGTCERYENDYLITITSVSHPEGVYCFKYYIENENATVVSGCCGNIYNIDPTFQNENGNPITNVSFYDTDENAQVSTSDVFYIRGINNSEIYNDKGEKILGIGRNGLIFKLEFIPAAQMSCVVNIVDAAPVNTTFVRHHPLNKWSIIIQHPIVPNLTISPTEPALSAYPPMYMYGQNTSIQVMLNNTNNITISNLSIAFYDSDIKIKQLENISVETWNKTRLIFSRCFGYSDLSHNITLRVNDSGMVILEAYCEVIVIQHPAIPSPSFDVNIAYIIVVVLIVALLATFKNRRGRK